MSCQSFPSHAMPSLNAGSTNQNCVRSPAVGIHVTLVFTSIHGISSYSQVCKGESDTTFSGAGIGSSKPFWKNGPIRLHQPFKMPGVETKASEESLGKFDCN